MQIIDEMVEAARKAFIGQWNGVVPFDTKSLDADMRAALEAVVPVIRAQVLEEAAMVADDMGRDEQTNTRDVDALMQACAREEMGYEVAAAIRAMKEPT